MLGDKVIVTCLVAALLFLAAGLQGAEVDSFTQRTLLRPDAARALNDAVNLRLEEGVAKANLLEWANAFDQVPGATCNEQTLYTELRKGLFQSLTASWGLKGYSLDQQMRSELADFTLQQELGTSVYQDFGYLDGPSLRLKGLTDAVWIDGHLIGLDKIGHFFAEGWSYFEPTWRGEAGLQESMIWGQQQEAGKFGLITTGVYSHADLVANFQGWRFWNRILWQQRDPLKGFWANLSGRQMVSCSLQILESLKRWEPVFRWELRQTFDIRDYVDGVWDEAHNCNRFSDARLEAQVNQRIAGIPASRGCPLSPTVCRRALAHYGGFAGDLLHPLCLTAAQNRNPPSETSLQNAKGL